MSALPLASYSAPGVNVWDYANNATAYNTSNKTWVAYTGQGFTGAYTTTISNADTVGILPTSVVLATIKSGLSNDPSSAWLMSSGCLSGSNNVQFVVAAQPASPSNFTISWMVAKY
jgi:hypothetical protein